MRQHRRTWTGRCGTECGWRTKRRVSNTISSQAQLLTHRLVPATVPWRSRQHGLRTLPYATLLWWRPGVWEDKHDEIQDDPCGGSAEGSENEKESEILAADACQLVSEPKNNMNQEKGMRDTGGPRHGGSPKRCRLLTKTSSDEGGSHVKVTPRRSGHRPHIDQMKQTKLWAAGGAVSRPFAPAAPAAPPFRPSGTQQKIPQCCPVRPRAAVPDPTPVHRGRRSPSTKAQQEWLETKHTRDGRHSHSD